MVLPAMIAVGVPIAVGLVFRLLGVGAEAVAARTGLRGSGFQVGRRNARGNRRGEQESQNQ